MHLVFLTPLGALVGLGIAVPTAAALLHRKRAARIRDELRLPHPPPRSGLTQALVVTILTILVATAAAQPALANRPPVRSRTDAAVYFAFDVSRSMLASQGPDGPTRLRRAVAEAQELRDDLAVFPIGIASFTDNTLPSTLPSTNRHDFRLATEQAVLVNSPPPDALTHNGTSLAALEDFATANYFPSHTPHRLVIAWTDGESKPFAAGQTVKLLRRAHIRLLVVRTWHADERIYDRRGHQDPGYRPQAGTDRPLTTFVHALGGDVYREGDLPAVAGAARRALGRGPTADSPGRRQLIPLAGYLFAAAALPFAFLLLRRRRFAPAAAPEEHDLEDWRPRQRVGRRRAAWVDHSKEAG